MYFQFKFKSKIQYFDERNVILWITFQPFNTNIWGGVESRGSLEGLLLTSKLTFKKIIEF
jgi:hypothetical protein